MNAEFLELMAADPDDRRALFFETAGRLPTTIQNVEKDFWVSWVLDLLFNGGEPGEPRLLFKGGTSLSKAHGLISRFSEDIDITVFREDIGQAIGIGELEKLSGHKRQDHLDAIIEASRHYIQGHLKDRLNRQITDTFKKAGIPVHEAPVLLDPADHLLQSLLVRYPSVSSEPDVYVKAQVKIEAGAKSALDPHRPMSITPYVAGELRKADLTVHGVLTIDAERTFWDKVLILHGLRSWFEKRKELRNDGNRESRHYYDVYKLMQSPVGRQAALNRVLALDCVRHARMFFNRPDFDLVHAHAGTFSIAPPPAMVEVLRRDYQAMAGMIFGGTPKIEDVLDTVQKLEQQINQPEAEGC